MGKPAGGGIVQRPRQLQHAAARVSCVLVLDDDPGYAAHVKQFLETRGLYVETAISSADAQRKLQGGMRRRKPFGIIVSDLQLGNDYRDGTDVLEDAKKACPDIVTILMSSMATTTVHGDPDLPIDAKLHKNGETTLPVLAALIETLQQYRH